MTHVLITRPLDASRELADSLRGIGLKPIVMPLYDFRERAPGVDLRAAWGEGDRRRLAVFTSPRAVQYGLPHIPAGLVAGLEYAAVGAATQARLEEAGRAVGVRAPGGYTSEDLLASPALAGKPGRAVIFAAPGGRRTLAEGLGRLGWDVTVAMVYERCPLPPAKTQAEAIAAAGSLISIWTSISAVELAQRNLPVAAWKKLLASPILVISARIAHHLRGRGARNTSLAAGPGNADLLQSVRRLVDTNGQ